MNKVIAWRKLFVFVPLLITVVLIYLAGQWNRGYLVVEGEAPFTVSITDGSNVLVTNLPFKRSLWVDQYQVTVTKTGFAPYKEEVQIIRGQEVIMKPVFKFLPIWQEVALAKKAASSFLAQGSKQIIPSNYQQLLLSGVTAWPQKAELLDDNIERLLLAPDLKKAVAWTKKGQLMWHDFPNGRSSSLNDAYINLAWSTDGRLLAFQPNKQDGSLMLLRSVSVTETLTSLAGMSGVSFYWAPNDKRFVFIPNGSLAERNIYLFDLTNQRKDKLTTKGNVVTVKWHPDSEQLLYETVTTGSLQPELHHLNLKNNADQVLTLVAKLSKTTWLTNEALAVVMPAKELIAGSEPTLADILDKLSSVKEELATGPLAKESRAEVVYRYDLSNHERTVLYTPTDRSLLIDELTTITAGETLRARSGERVFELQLVPYNKNQ